MTEPEPLNEEAKIRAMAVIPGANPFEVFLLFACLLLSFTRIIRLSPPSSLGNSLPPWAVTLWYASLGIGSAIAIYGGMRRRSVHTRTGETTLLTGLTQYMVGWSYVGTASLTYGMLVLSLHPEVGAVAGSLTTAWGLASIGRAYQVHKFIQRSRTGGGRHKHV